MEVNRTACSTPDLEPELGFDLGIHFPPPRPPAHPQVRSMTPGATHVLQDSWTGELGENYSANDLPSSLPRSSESGHSSSATAHNVLHKPQPTSSYLKPSVTTYSLRSLEDGIHYPATPRPRSGISSALAAFSKRVRRSGVREPDIVPFQQRHTSSIATGTMPSDARPPDLAINLGPWPPLLVEKHPPTHACDYCECKHTDPKRKRRRRLCLALLVVIILYLLANLIFLNVRVLDLSSSMSSDVDSNPSSSSGATSSTLSVAQETCLTQFTVDAPSNASAYPCATCLSLLQAIPSNFISVSGSSAGDAQTLSDSIQFCGLQSLFVASGATAQSALASVGWVQDVNFCTWSGVQCNGNGRVASLELIFPAVPSVIPSGIGTLTSLGTLQITGGGTSPAGSLPSSFTNLTALSTLSLSSTALSALPSALFAPGALNNLTTLSLVKNAGLGGILPSIGALKLESLVIDSQALSTPLAEILNGTTLQGSLKTLSITSAALNSTIPASISLFSALTELHLDNDNLQAPLPPAFPSSLQILTFSNNSGLSGSLPESLCSSKTLTTCTLSGTGFGGASNCGVCTF